jgi:hypothetical protein
MNRDATFSGTYPGTGHAAEIAKSQRMTPKENWVHYAKR